jgi:hypothetical protein
MSQTQAKITYEGQEVALPEEIASDDSKIRAALCTAWPSITTADIKRTRENNQLVVACTRKAGSKGSVTSEIIEKLQTVREKINPAAVFAAQLDDIRTKGKLTPYYLATQQENIEKAIDRGVKDRSKISMTIESLSRLPGRPSTKVPSGF